MSRDIPTLVGFIVRGLYGIFLPLFSLMCFFGVLNAGHLQIPWFARFRVQGFTGLGLIRFH